MLFRAIYSLLNGPVLFLQEFFWILFFGFLKLLFPVQGITVARLIGLLIESGCALLAAEGFKVCQPADCQSGTCF